MRSLWLFLLMAGVAAADSVCGTALEVHIADGQLDLEKCSVAGVDANGVAWSKEFAAADYDLAEGVVLSFAAALEPLTFPTSFGAVCEDTSGNSSEYAEPSGECVPPSRPGIVTGPE